MWQGPFCTGMSSADCTAVGLAWPAMALWGPESISRVVLTAKAGAWGWLYLPSPWNAQVLKDALGSSFPIKQIEQACTFDKLLTSIQI